MCTKTSVLRVSVMPITRSKFDEKVWTSSVKGFFLLGIFLLPRTRLKR